MSKNPSSPLDTCPTCDGSGHIDLELKGSRFNPQSCPACQGEGKLPANPPFPGHDQRNTDYWKARAKLLANPIHSQVPCPDCEGEKWVCYGEHWEHTPSCLACETCNGTGQVPEGGKPLMFPRRTGQSEVRKLTTPTEGGKPEAPCWNCDSMDWESADGSYWRCAVCREFPVPAPVQAKLEEPMQQVEDSMAQTLADNDREIARQLAPEPQPESELDDMLIEVRYGRMSNTKAKSIIDRYLAAAHSAGKREAEDILRELRKPDRAHPKAIRVAEALGKDPTFKGPLAQARTDGWNVALDTALAALEPKQKEEL